ncbi:MAG: hypothetical protein LBF15_00445 [Candidatus Peribacteria bacterium]|jgi:hypothetical protein|nr:hypothetical protein [Candidatus Peribacteria bacterium]
MEGSNSNEEQKVEEIETPPLEEAPVPPVLPEEATNDNDEIFVTPPEEGVVNDEELVTTPTEE